MKQVQSLEQLDARRFVIIKGARTHNLKNLSVAIPRNKLVVLTGLSGSGKSSLAFDTLYAEGQRRYVESLSSYARQFLGRINKPDVDYIKGIAPAVAIEQKVITRNPRSTVGTTTEIYDYLKLLFARIGKTVSPVSGTIVKREKVSDVVDYLLSAKQGERFYIVSPMPLKSDQTLKALVTLLVQQGFTRFIRKGEVKRLDEILESPSLLKEMEKEKKNPLHLVVDRVVIDPSDPDQQARLADSVQTAFFEGRGSCLVIRAEDLSQREFNNRFEADGITFEEPSVHFFSFNNPLGACRKCDGFGTTIGIDPDLVIPDQSLSVYDGAVACWRGDTMREWKDAFVRGAAKHKFPVHKPYAELNEEQKALLWDGSGKLEGIHAFFAFLEEQTYKIQYRVMLSRYRGKTVCPDCKGSRLRKEAQYVKVAGMSIGEIVQMPVKRSRVFFEEIKLEPTDAKIAGRLLQEIRNRLGFLADVGLGYLTLNRMSNSLSGGESQRINLATCLGSSLVGSLYILDEPSIGLHPRDTDRLIKVLLRLRDLGNTVVVVEHDEEIMKAADRIIDIGPLSGSQGGEVVFEGNWDEILVEKESLTARYLNGSEVIPLPGYRRKWKEKIVLSGARENNLRGIQVQFPLEVLCVVTGVSGSGKTSLVKKILYPALKKRFEGYVEQTGMYDNIDGSLNRIEAIEMIDQNPIGKSSRSNPVTYIKAWDDIRALMTEQPIAKLRGYKPNVFSFNVEGGRCEMCQGEGEVKIEMQFMADIHLACEVCEGKRFKQDILEVEYRGKNVHELLGMTIDDAIAFFGEGQSATEKRIVQKLQPLSDVGLGYVQLGQSSSTLSGGEAQRIKLATFLVKGQAQSKTLFIFDEPTTGLHFHDIRKLLYAFQALVDQGHSLIVIEHHPEIIKCADWVIDMGPEGGDEGGSVVFAGIPEDLIKEKKSHTGKYLKEKLI
jgi:excinuclease ABC subunit A